MMMSNYLSNEILFFVKGKEIFSVSFIISFQSVIKLLRREFVIFYNFILFIPEIKITYNVVNICVPVNSPFAPCEGQGPGKVFGANMMPHGKHKVAIIPDTKSRPICQIPIFSVHGAGTVRVD